MANHVADKIALSLTGADDLEKAVYKATNADVVRPKKKHVTHCVDLIRARHSVERIIQLTLRRLHDTHWVCVLKALTLLHHFIREGGTMFLDTLLRERGRVEVSMFSDQSSLEAQDMSRVIHHYSAFLQARIDSYRRNAIDFPALTLNETMQQLHEMAIGDEIKRVKEMQALFVLTLKTEFVWEQLCNEPAVYAFLLTLKDATRLFVAINNSVITLLESFFTLKLDSARDVYHIYRDFATQTEQTVKLLDLSKQIRLEDYADMRRQKELPEIKSVPEQLLHALQTHIEHQEENLAAERKASTQVPIQKFSIPAPSASTNTRRQTDSHDSSSLLMFAPPPSNTIKSRVGSAAALAVVAAPVPAAAAVRAPVEEDDDPFLALSRERIQQGSSASLSASPAVPPAAATLSLVHSLQSLTVDDFDPLRSSASGSGLALPSVSPLLVPQPGKADYNDAHFASVSPKPPRTVSPLPPQQHQQQQQQQQAYAGSVFHPHGVPAAAATWSAHTVHHPMPSATPAYNNIPARPAEPHIPAFHVQQQYQPPFPQHQPQAYQPQSFPQMPPQQQHQQQQQQQQSAPDPFGW